MRELTANPTDSAAAAVCEIAIQLAKLGQDITIFSYSPQTEFNNVRCRHIEIKDQALQLDPALLENDFNCLIFKNTSPEFALSIRGALPYKPKVFIWTEHDHLEQLNRGLWNESIVNELDGVICVSYWQRTQLVDALPILHNKIFVLKYGICPAFENLFLDIKEFIHIKTVAPSLAYIAKQENGLEILLDSYYNISDNYKNTSLSIFTEITDPNLQHMVQNARGVKVYGTLTKKQLAEILRTHTILVNPNTIAQTSNVTLLEAMAAGLYPVTSDVGANEDYCRGHGKIVRREDLDSNTLDNYISELLVICQAQVHQAEDFYDYCFKLTVDMNKKHTWHIRAKELVEVLS